MTQAQMDRNSRGRSAFSTLEDAGSEISWPKFVKLYCQQNSVPYGVGLAEAAQAWKEYKVENGIATGRAKRMLQKHKDYEDGYGFGHAAPAPTSSSSKKEALRQQQQTQPIQQQQQAQQIRKKKKIIPVEEKKEQPKEVIRKRKETGGLVVDDKFLKRRKTEATASYEAEKQRQFSDTPRPSKQGAKRARMEVELKDLQLKLKKAEETLSEKRKTTKVMIPQKSNSFEEEYVFEKRGMSAQPQYMLHDEAEEEEEVDIEEDSDREEDESDGEEDEEME